jgi:SAM-dependent methyltransferase
MLPPTSRFSSRVEDYLKYRPGYPPELIGALEQMVGFTSDWKVADIGSGTGKLSELFLDAGCEVTGVEPNLEMRLAAEKLLGNRSNFLSVDASAEDTTLSPKAYDLITAGQAFHWFDAEKSKAEFRRIISDRGWVALIWNDRRTTGTPFLNAYQSLLKSLPEYGTVGHKITGAMKLRGFFDQEPLFWSAPTSQEFDWEGLLGRALSSSYVPSPSHPEHFSFVERLRSVFDATEISGKVAFSYETQMFLGKL